ncbi:zf-HC2 domain-containing protein [Streptomyces pyxinae]|uniref:zf-HC2 domain-containing protein n=1 Tax=Streptomyces pyxinae TaxID=2970734 RepID=UPI002867EC8A|nr:zf-HC2 domain-containing protein [Streptomyces sp. LP05-1]
MTSADPHLAAGAYTLHALPPDEEAAFENHLAGCTACRREVDAFTELTAGLGGLCRVVPPPELRARTLAGAARISREAAPPLPRPRGRGRR